MSQRTWDPVSWILQKRVWHNPEECAVESNLVLAGSRLHDLKSNACMSVISKHISAEFRDLALIWRSCTDGVVRGPQQKSTVEGCAACGPLRLQEQRALRAKVRSLWPSDGFLAPSRFSVLYRETWKEGLESPLEKGGVLHLTSPWWGQSEASWDTCPSLKDWCHGLPSLRQRTVLNMVITVVFSYTNMAGGAGLMHTLSPYRTDSSISLAL